MNSVKKSRHKIQHEYVVQAQLNKYNTFFSKTNENDIPFRTMI